MKRLFVLFSLIALGCSYVFFATGANSKKIDYILDEESFQTIEEAIQTGYDPSQSVSIFQIGFKEEDIVYVLYTVDQDQLLTELLYQEENEYRKIIDSRLIIGGTSVEEAEYKIRTFLITDGPWLTGNHPFTFVTFGHINSPENVDSVEVRYEGQYKRINLENKTFFNIASSPHQWDTLHPVVFYNKDREDIGGFMKDMLFANAYCH
ncbi:hypothetical protein DS745_16025 [Anaerobacillus alkaliphilus]|uniref:Uncharacterized protein n=1 Tax=Anaerobacillus alkaliphilus TaxID=1548597 RepID=A0A4Q0VPQ3_9BACI|nr:hypothetical protein [Anaerobacillus alkaliphilus]RXI97867.1 hypothetical protein DS745_16025 [Anaerobacillus alkaliphilus]